NDALSKELSVKVDKSKFSALVAEVNIAGEKCLLMKPQTFMNNSGEALIQAVNFYKIPPENVLVVFDDISLEPGSLRIRRKGSSGGHNGIKSITAHLKTEDFPRIKIGIGGKPNEDYSLADFVLSKIEKKDKVKIEKALENAFEASKLIIKGDVEKAMNLYNS
ncbi:MAG: aminoacyl-tRNA hydrolase, partial [Oscillospiraceae bacterium]